VECGGIDQNIRAKVFQSIFNGTGRADIELLAAWRVYFMMRGIAYDISAQLACFPYEEYFHG
jgi:hypothetical protein